MFLVFFCIYSVKVCTGTDLVSLVKTDLAPPQNSTVMFFRDVKS